MIINIDNEYALTLINDVVCCCIANQEDRNLYNNMYRTMVESGVFEQVFSNPNEPVDLNQMVQDDYYNYCRVINKGDKLFDECVNIINKNQSFFDDETTFIASYMVDDDDSPYKFLIKDTKQITTQTPIAAE